MHSKVSLVYKGMTSKTENELKIKKKRNRKTKKTRISQKRLTKSLINKFDWHIEFLAFSFLTALTKAIIP